MPELKPLPLSSPCPHCWSDDIGSTNDGHDFWVFCRKCTTSGPMAGTEYDAFIAWDALPRALRWTTEPPKVSWWYWVRQREGIDRPWGRPRIVKITNVQLCTSDCWQYAGPIPTPLD